jgi:hypothetical protein
MNRARSLKTTKNLHIAWALFVGFWFALYMPEIGQSGNFLLPLLDLSRSESMIGMMLGASFCITPFITLLAFRRITAPLLIGAVILNLASLIFGATEFFHELDPSNAMIVLALAIPSMTVVAATLGVLNLASLLKSQWHQL